MMSQVGSAEISRTDLAGMHLAGADMRHVNLQVACLHGTDLHCAIFKSVHFIGSHIRNTRCLTCSQLKEAAVDDETRLPDYPDSCQR